MTSRNEQILITGGSGTLGTQLQKHASFIAPPVEAWDITNLEQCKSIIAQHDPTVIVHAAAWTNVAEAESHKDEVWKVNVGGTQNIAQAAVGRRLVYISTDYVFDGTKGDYREEDTPNPQNFYALTKLMGEGIIKQYPHTLVIRTAFKKNGPWPYPKAFEDQWSSHEFVATLAPQILQAVLMMDLVGVIHIAGKRKRMLELARQVSPTVEAMSIRDVPVTLPQDTSLNSSKWHQIQSQSSPAK